MIFHSLPSFITYLVIFTSEVNFLNILEPLDSASSQPYKHNFVDRCRNKHTLVNCHPYSALGSQGWDKDSNFNSLTQSQGGHLLGFRTISWFGSLTPKIKVNLCLIHLKWSNLLENLSRKASSSLKY